MAKKRLRKPKGLEGNTLWVVLVVLVALGSCGLTQLYKLFAGVIRGYTFIGVVLGLVATLVFFGTFAFSLRKRSLQESKVLGRSSMMAWMTGHVWLGILAIVVGWAHAGNGVFSFNLSTGKALFWTMALVVVTGAIWRIVYWRVPQKAAKEVGNYNRAATEELAREQWVEIEKLSAGKSERFRQLKDELVEGRELRPGELDQVRAELPANEQFVFSEVAQIASLRKAELNKLHGQRRFGRALQVWRAAHVPVALALMVMLPLHVCGGCDMPAKITPVGAVANATMGGFHPAEDCRQCHEEIVEQWSHSMHAHAMKSPVMVVQNNQVAKHILANAPKPDPQEVCTNCHGPIGAALNEQTTLPFSAGFIGSTKYLNEGVTCSVCHQWNGTPKTGSGGLVSFQAGLKPGTTFFGPREDPVGNAFHSSEKIPLFDTPDELCRNCHVVAYDKNADGRLVRGDDLILQQLFDEWRDYQAQGNPDTCVSCHMPLTGSTKAASNAWPLVEADGTLPDRPVRDHSFVGVDYPIDISPDEDHHKEKRVALLRSAGKLTVSGVQNLGNQVAFTATLTNTGTGHNLPAGFAFVRQMWIEVRVLDAGGRTIGSSGVLASNEHDLCDATTFNSNNPVSKFVRGCSAVDSQLVSFQQLLLDKIQPALDASGNRKLDAKGEALHEAAPGAVEVVIQHLTSGAVPRIRPFDKRPVKPVPPGKSSSFAYRLPVNGAPATLAVRLMFRALPPYFLRALAAGKVGSAGPDLDDLVKNCSSDSMAEQTVRL